MQKLRGSRILLILMTCLVMGGLVAGALETEGPNHQDEVHHCVSCCNAAHAAVPVKPVNTITVAPIATPHSLELASLNSLSIDRRLDPPPKLSL